MTQLLLQTKLRPTFTASRLLHRDHLLRRLNQTEGVRLILVHGAAGAGKSSLLCDFVKQSSQPVAWYNLGSEDRDPKVFLTYAMRSLMDTFPGCLKEAPEMLEGLSAVEPSWEALATLMANELLRYDRRVMLLLDDYHLVDSNSTIREWLTFMLRKGPSNLTFLLSTREVPGVPLSYLRAKGMLLELSDEELRFTEAEAGKLFREVWHLPVPDSLVPVLLSKTEGWITGLQLVGKAIAGKDEDQIRSYVENLEGRVQIIYTYLADEVFALQTPEVQQFLKFTSVTDMFTPELAHELAGGNAYEMLHHLDAARLFLIHLTGEWFRYHHLFLDFLRHKLNLDEGLQRVRNLHARAAVWYAERGDWAPAIQHHLAAGEMEKAAGLLERNGTLLLGRGMQTSLTEWLLAIPLSMRESAPGLLALEAEIADLAGDWGRAMEGYRDALNRYRDVGQRERSVAVLEKLCLCYVKYGDSKMLIRTCEEGLEECPPDNQALRSMLSAWLGNALVYSGADWDRGYAAVQESHAMATASGDPRAISWACMIYGFVYHFVQGNFGESLQILNEGIAYFQRQGWALVVYQLAMNKAVVQIIQGDLQAAEALITETLTRADEAGHVYVVRGMQNLKAMAYIEMRELARADAEMQKVEQSQIPAQMKPWTFRHRMLLNYLEGNVEQALVSCGEMDRALESSGMGMYAPECLAAKGYVLIGIDRVEEAGAVLRQGLELARKGRTKFWEMKLHMLLASLTRDHTDRKPFRAHLARALELCAANHYHRYWAQDPWRVGVPLLVEALAARQAVELSRQLLEQVGPALVERLAPLLDDEGAGPAVRATAASLLGRQGGQEAVQALRVLRVADPSLSVRRTAGKVLEHDLRASTRLEFLALGPFQILRDGEPISLSRGKFSPMTLRVLRYFLTRWEDLFGEEAMEQFWPDSPRARHNLRMRVHLLRKALGLGDEDLILWGLEGYRLQFGPDFQYDAREFLRLATDARRAQMQGDKRTARSTFQRAEQLYAGDFMADEPYDEWIVQRRDDLRGRYHAAVEFLADLDAEDFNYAEAIRRYRLLLAQDRLEERVLSKLLDCYGRIGDRSAGLREYEDFRARLASSTGLEPSPATEALVKRLLSSA